MVAVVPEAAPGSVLSIQSRVSYGYVGNSVAAFALQRLGREVWAVDTVRFSNHPGYGAWTGAPAAASDVQSIIDGIAARGVLRGCDAVLSGYLGTEAVGGAVLHGIDLVRAANPSALFCCDPVIGDFGPGVYVGPGIPGLLRSKLVPAADVLTPNQFELQHLTGMGVATADEAAAAAAQLRTVMRPGAVVLVTSIRVSGTPSDALDMAAFGDSGSWWLRTPLLPIMPSGAGDLMAALFLHCLLAGSGMAEALEAAGNAVFGVLAQTVATGSREMQVILAQDEIVSPTHRFSVEPRFRRG